MIRFTKIKALLCTCRLHSALNLQRTLLKYDADYYAQPVKKPSKNDQCTQRTISSSLILLRKINLAMKYFNTKHTYLGAPVHKQWNRFYALAVDASKLDAGTAVEPVAAVDQPSKWLFLETRAFLLEPCLPERSKEQARRHSECRNSEQWKKW